MIFGTITINTCYGEANLSVEVLGEGPRPGTAWVKALGGLEPFTRISHGGPFQSNTAIFPMASIRNLFVQKDPARKVEKPIALEHVISGGRFLEGVYDDHALKK